MVNNEDETRTPESEEVGDKTVTPCATRIGLAYIVSNSQDVDADELVNRLCGYLELCGIAVLYD